MNKTLSYIHPTVKNHTVQKLLRVEAARKSLVASISFFLFGMTVYFYHFRLSEQKFLIQVLCLITLFVSAFRYFVSTKILVVEETDNYWRVFKVAVFINGVCWGAIFAVAAFELNFSGAGYIVVITILTSFVSASLATLAYDKWLFMPFQVNLLLPLIILSLRHGLATDNPDHIMISFLFVLAFIYQLKQYKEFHGHFLDRLAQEVDLQRSNEALKESKEALENQTIKLVHTSRIAALGEMSGGLSHEMNNSLMVISGAIHHLERKLKSDGRDFSNYSKTLEQMSRAIKKIKDVVDGLKYFSQEKESLPKENIEVEAVMNKTLGLCREMITASGISLLVSDIPDVKIQCRAVQISQILFTLIRNAYDALAIVVEEEERWMRISVSSEGDKVYFRVANGGNRISNGSIAKLFQPFFTTKDVEGGAGLSLSIAKGIAKDHSGDLYLDQESPKTTFVLELPTGG